VVNLMTVKEQLLYEVTDPRAYATPDVLADFTTVQIKQTGPDRVAVAGATGRPQPQQLKVSIGYHAGWVGEGEISYGGPNARARAQLAADTLRQRLAPEFEALRVDLIGLNSLHGRPLHAVSEPYEIRVRIAARAGIRDKAERVGEEVEALWTNGPGGGGGARKSVREQIGVVSTLIERERVRPELHITEVSGEKATV
jgi:hypothetical protein